MDPSNSAPTTAWPAPNNTSSNLPPYSKEPATAVSLPQRNSEWVDDTITTAFPQTPLEREDPLAPFFPTGRRQVATAQSSILSPTSAYPPTPISDHARQVSGYASQNHRRTSSKYSEYGYRIPVPHSARFQRDLQSERVDSQNPGYYASNLPDFLSSSGGLVSSSVTCQKNAHPGTSQLPRTQTRLFDLTQSPVIPGSPQLFPEFNDIRSDTASRTMIPQADVLHQRPPEQPHVGHLHSQEHQQQFLAPLGSSQSKPPTRTKRSSSIITGLDQGIFRNPAQPPHHLQNRDNFYAYQKDDSRFSRYLPPNREHIPRRKRASSSERSSIQKDREQAKIWDERMDAGRQPSKPTDRIPTYQEFRRTTPRSDQCPSPTSAISPYHHFGPGLRPSRESDLRFGPKMVREIYEERWKISQGYEQLRGYFSDPKEGVYKDLVWEEWLEIYHYLKGRDERAMERELVLELKAN
ncbi:hypothetical protein DSL72_003250 [Monilinia vaccinii-corymbosi]|uniref:Uncharacterized protein n=1 Tax=Monilinia vaccinii-corymbosi TaxID=61207 RepID=A0A8A3P5J6_9HELO|nr:hypothetical protein DSL72_003250 [Monilinia vaccinii-corymbosi]